MKALIAARGLKEMRGPFIDMLHQAGFELAYPPGSTPLTEEELLPQLQGVRAAVAGPEPNTRRVIEANPALRLIARVGFGFDAVDLDAATQTRNDPDLRYPPYRRPKALRELVAS